MLGGDAAFVDVKRDMTFLTVFFRKIPKKWLTISSAREEGLVVFPSCKVLSKIVITRLGLMAKTVLQNTIYFS
ncbi:hypothetical protein LJC53_04960 [Bacteroidales bacterium OttesenSCG-928-C03]|nr:hypothetical protein [Bacteroidales bacterium OttesenSCG-928-C03]MDL2326073.1 hypothetical protein [Bacteroidales bacterium OttesenSCG-928-A14]